MDKIIKKNSAFSLIELMVVLAIVAILAAIAVPAYKNYLIKTKMMSAISAFQDINKQAVEFANINGRFSTPYELGLSLDTSPANSRVDPDITYTMPPYFDDRGYYQISDLSGGCGACGVALITMNLHRIGFDVPEDQ